MKSMIRFRTSVALLSILLILAGGSASPARTRRDDDDKYRKAVKGFHLPSKGAMDAIAAKNPEFKKYVRWLQAEENWIEVLKQIEDQTGLFFSNLDIKVEVIPGSDGMRKGRGSGSRGKGWLKIWLGGMKEMYTVWKTIVHEVSHIFTGADKLGPMWIVEGHANYTGEISSGVPLMNGTINPISDSLAVSMCYGRGWLFFVYIARKYGKEAPKKFFQHRVMEGMNYRAAFEKATSVKWDTLVQEEYAWTKENWEKVYNEYSTWGDFKVSFGFDSSESEEGLKVTKFRGDSSAEKSGLKVGDLITHFNGKRLWGQYDFLRRGSGLKPGDKVELTVERGGKEEKITVTVGERK